MKLVYRCCCYGDGFGTGIGLKMPLLFVSGLSLLLSRSLSPFPLIRGLCPDTEELGSDRPLPFINPSSLETLRVLVQEIQSSGQTDPEVWKNCEVRRGRPGWGMGCGEWCNGSG